MQSAQLKSVSVFDATMSYSFSYVWSGEQTLHQKLTIRNNETYAVIGEFWNDTQDARFALPADSITNGYKYSATITIYGGPDAEDPSGYRRLSDESPSISFWCHSGATISSSVPALIPSSEYTFTANYSQLDDEGLSDALSYYQFIIYNANHSPIKTGDTTYLNYVEWVSGGVYDVGTVVLYNGAVYTSLTDDGGSHVPTDPEYWSLGFQFQYKYQGFIDSMVYAVKIFGTTTAGENLETDFYDFRVKYEEQTIYTAVGLENDKCTGTIIVNSNLVSVEGHTDIVPVTYVDGEYVDMRNSSVVFDEGFDVPTGSEFVLGAEIKDFKQNEILLGWTDNSGYTGRTYYREAVFECNENVNKGYFELVVNCNGYISVIDSDFIDPVSSDEEYRVYIKRINREDGQKLYILEIAKIEEVGE